MTTTITNVTEQCSPRQCFEELGIGQTTIEPGGADAYTECRCENLFTLSGLTAPLLLWQAVRHVSTYQELSSELGKTLVEEAGVRLRVAKDKMTYRDHEGGYGDLVAALKFLDKDVIERLESGLLNDHQNEALLNDLVVAYRKGASYYNHIRQFETASQYYLKAAEYVAKYAEASSDHSATWGMDRPEQDMGSYDADEYMKLVEYAVEAKEAIALSPNGSGANYKEISAIYKDAAQVLTNNRSNADAREFMDRSDDAEFKEAVYQWMDQNVKGWRTGADMGIKKHFERTLAIVKAEGPVTPETIAGVIRRDLDKKAVELHVKLVELVSSKAEDQSSYLELNRKRAGVVGQLSQLYYEAGEIEMVVRMKAAEVVYLVEAQYYSTAENASIQLIHLARYAKLRKSEGDGYKMRAGIYLRKNEWERALEAYKEAIKCYRKVGYKGVELTEAVRGKEFVSAKVRGGNMPRAIGVEGEGGLGAIGTERKGGKTEGPGKEEREGRERPGK